ncbi:1-acyl-sn-glycerol-3-phosphate acyltransferase [Hartmannibacter diazotrophicus]|uniref:1-acyl-sn-glycerol-3-phosphate acyltransferase n=1 Tax=Hartmannibacter diazotrophicus TaxID=1482074 RepID=A0A2C9DE93_9HYPH|nr:lysophospholipid acyltransferase family protein [Hartmannibacter diazotrophicus]SON58201.1 1-acyl-sn-glycerol-3-phosphate acyltransferase [Hartmannibacter diazotrophicus]
MRADRSVHPVPEETKTSGGHWLRQTGAIVKLSGLFVFTLPLIPVQMVAIRRNWPLARTLPVFWHRIASRLLGLRITVKGMPAEARPLLIAANHVSWLDIVVFSAVMPVSFVAKSEVGTWPVFGTLARLQRSVFVERQKRGRTADQARDIADRLTLGDAIILFPEGTSSDGGTVLPFRSALVGAAKAAIDAGDGEEALIQPVAIAYTRFHGMPAGRNGRLMLSWIGDVDLVPHLLLVMREAAVDVSVLFGEPIAFGRGSDRKTVTQMAETAVRRMLADELSGRDFVNDTALLKDPPILKAEEKG